MDESTDESEVDEAEAFLARRQARRKVVARLFVGVVGVGLVFVAFQWVLQRQLRHDAASRGMEALHAYVSVLREASGESLASTLEQRFLAASVRHYGRPDLSEASEACRDLRDALHDLPDDALFYEAPDLTTCTLLVGLSPDCGAVSPSTSDAVEQHLGRLRECADVLVSMGNDLTPPALRDAGRATPLSPMSLPKLPEADELYGRPVWFPTATAIVAVLWLRNEERCVSTPDFEALDCIRPATFIAQVGHDPGLVFFPLPEGMRAWHNATVDEHGVFVAWARGPGKQQLIARRPNEEPRSVTLRWDDEPLRPEELADPAWLNDAWQARERKPPPVVGAPWSRTPTVGRTAIELGDGSVVAAHRVATDRLIFARQEPDGSTYYRELVSADSGRVEPPNLTATRDGALVVSWQADPGLQFVWSLDGGRTWLPAVSPAGG